jgi:hypothetical protein
VVTSADCRRRYRGGGNQCSHPLDSPEHESNSNPAPSRSGVSGAHQREICPKTGSCGCGDGVVQRFEVGGHQQVGALVTASALLSPVVPDELNVTISALNLCREAKIKEIAYLSVFRVEETADVPHFASRFAAERCAEQAKP